MELGAGEIVVILVIVLLLFGPSKLPRLGEELGSAMANFRKALRGDDSEPNTSTTARDGASPPPSRSPEDRAAGRDPRE